MLSVEYQGRSTTVEAFVDSGNLAVDPFDKTPVMLISAQLADRIYDINALELENIDGINISLRKKLRVIPVSFGKEKKILYGLKPDRVFIKNKKREERISLTIDKEGGNYGGYNALIPLSALDDVL